jgi:hypothetical protein
MFSGRSDTQLRERYLNFFFLDARVRAAGAESEGQCQQRRWTGSLAAGAT